MGPLGPYPLYSFQNNKKSRIKLNICDLAYF